MILKLWYYVIYIISVNFCAFYIIYSKLICSNLKVIWPNHTSCYLEQFECEKIVSSASDFIVKCYLYQKFLICLFKEPGSSGFYQLCSHFALSEYILLRLFSHKNFRNIFWASQIPINFALSNNIFSLVSVSERGLYPLKKSRFSLVCE